MHSKTSSKTVKSSQSKGEMPKGNDARTSRKESNGFSNKHNTSQGAGLHGNKFIASCSVK